MSEKLISARDGWRLHRCRDGVLTDHLIIAWRDTEAGLVPVCFKPLLPDDQWAVVYKGDIVVALSDDGTERNLNAWLNRVGARPGVGRPLPQREPTFTVERKRTRA